MLNKNEDSDHKDNDLHPLVSVVLTTKNEEKNIYRCLQSIQSQTYKNLEIIVVDNYSEDQTIKIAKEFTSKIFLKGPERSAQRNYGMIDVAKGIFVIYIDADMILSNRCWSVFKD
jgi:glycosyltransferase involved in cell wall biosynthesis